MERFTKRVMDIVVYTGPDAQHPETGDTAAELTTRSARTLLSQLAAYEDTGLTPKEIKDADDFLKENYHLGVDELVEAYTLLMLHKDKRLLPIPCRIGSEVYVISHKYRAGRDEWWINTGKFRPSDLEKIGDRVFLTYEDAKAKIFAMNKDNKRFWFQDANGDVFYN